MKRAEASFAFLFDHHVGWPACRQLASRGVDVVHALEVGLSRADDADLLLWATRENRSVVTRNHRDFAPLVVAHAERPEEIPGVLFIPSTLPDRDPDAHVRALEAWIAEARASGRNPVRGTFGWLSAPR